MPRKVVAIITKAMSFSFTFLHNLYSQPKKCKWYSCHIGNHYMGILGYADYLAILSPSLQGFNGKDMWTICYWLSDLIQHDIVKIFQEKIKIVDGFYTTTKIVQNMYCSSNSILSILAFCIVLILRSYTIHFVWMCTVVNY